MGTLGGGVYPIFVPPCTYYICVKKGHIEEYLGKTKTATVLCGNGKKGTHIFSLILQIFTIYPSMPLELLEIRESVVCTSKSTSTKHEMPLFGDHTGMSQEVSKWVVTYL